MAPLLRASLFLLTTFTAAACTSETASPPASTPPPSETPPEEPPTEPTPDPAEMACRAEKAKLQKGLDLAHSKSTDVVLAVKTPSCGLRVLSSGPGKVTPAHVHRIGSVTKTYVSAVILGLAREGTLSLEDPVTKWIANDVSSPDKLAGITIRHLLNHTSGLYNYTKDPALFKDGLLKKHTPKELVDLALGHAPSFTPGKDWEYSNTGYILLGMIAEKAGQAKIGALVRSRVLEKAKLAATFFDGEEPVSATLATGRSESGADVTVAHDVSWAWAAGAMVATPGDVVSWIEQLGSGAFHDAATQTELLTPAPTSPKLRGYGLGVMLFPAEITGGGGPAIGHGGDIVGYHTQSFYFPEKKTTIVAIADSDAESPNDLSIVALDVLFAKKN